MPLPSARVGTHLQFPRPCTSPRCGCSASAPIASPAPSPTTSCSILAANGGASSRCGKRRIRLCRTRFGVPAHGGTLWRGRSAGTTAPRLGLPPLPLLPKPQQSTRHPPTAVDRNAICSVGGLAVLNLPFCS
ncbi:hypothetical protein BS78_K069500 [Paspalum vaginatum]|uniref:Uncharacterized protein n=1 Tax=Paspalum vaginatum TaxID=158149 RepID=A0A9W7XF23_9POAL|nr:hypothetical protein BS78_K069500 [Paspalum vaginatum]